MTTLAELAALTARLEANGVPQRAARTHLEGGSAIAVIHRGAPTPPSLLVLRPPPPPLRPIEARALAAAHDADIPPQVAAQLASHRAAHLAKNPNDKPERVEQVVLAAWLDGLACIGPRKWCHPPNERSSAREAARLSEEGVKPGVPDVLIFKRTRALAPGLAIEMKAPKRRREADPYAGTSETQRDWIESLLEEGWVCAVCYSAEEAAEVVINTYEGVTP